MAVNASQLKLQRIVEFRAMSSMMGRTETLGVQDVLYNVEQAAVSLWGRCYGIKLPHPVRAHADYI